MRILPTDVTLIGTFSSLHEDTNYPPENLARQFMKEIFRSTGNTDTVTVTLPVAKDIDCIYFGFTNATSLSVRLYSAADVLLATKTISLSRLGGYFTKVVGVKYFKIDIEAATPAYIGTFSAGLSYLMPNPIADVIKDFIDPSFRGASTDGQSLMNKKAWLITTPFSFYMESVDKYNEIYEIFSLNSRPIWVDPFENTTGMYNPLYCSAVLGKPKKSGRKYTFDVTVKEAR